MLTSSGSAPPTTTLKSWAVQKIRSEILSGRFKPGDRLNETRLAEEFNISRIPIREALLQLHEQGLVMNQPRRGMFVTQLSEEDVQRINSLRIILEAEALKLCRANITASYDAHLGSLVEKLEHSLKEPDYRAAMLDLEFHRALWVGSGNPYIEKTLNSLVLILFSHQTLSYLSVPGTRHWPLNHHRALLDVVRGVSNITPEEAMVNHLRLRYTNPERFSSLALSR